jgi:hypothetical protein
VIRAPLLTIVRLLAVLPAVGQSGSAYSAESFVIRHASAVIEMKADGTGEQTETMVAAVQSEAAARQLSVVDTIHTKQPQHAEFVYVRVRHPDDMTVETPLGYVQDQAAPVTQQAPFYIGIFTKQLLWSHTNAH